MKFIRLLQGRGLQRRTWRDADDILSLSWRLRIRGNPIGGRASVAQGSCRKNSRREGAHAQAARSLQLQRPVWLPAHRSLTRKESGNVI